MSMPQGWKLHAPSAPDAPRLHRLREVRLEQGVSRRAMARRLGVEPAQLDAMEDPRANLTLSTLYRWQKVLDVPVEDLLIDGEAPLSRPVMERARMLKLMKTAVTIRERSKNNGVTRLTEMLLAQIIEIMPELKDIGGWHGVSERPTGVEGSGSFAKRQAEQRFLERALRKDP